MINRFSFLFLTGMFLFAALPKSVLADISLDIATDTHTHTSTSELKPASLEGSYQTASVCFLGVGDCASDGNDYGVDSEEQCLSSGYSKNSCGSLEEPLNICPYNPAYSKGCKCKSSLISCPSGQAGVGASCDGKYVSCECDTNLKTCASNEVGSGSSCGGKYQSCSCKSEYQYTSSNCSYPRSVSGSSCGGKYSNCVCPTGVSTGSYGCQEYYPSPCNSVCKIAKGDNCDKRTEVQTPYGCMSYFADCPSKCERAYTDNCRNRTAVTCQFGCTSYFADCQTKCQSCTADNCANRTAVSTPYGCQTYWSDCSSKCQTAYPDNCRNRTAVSVPANATCSQYFSDCSSKCEAWICNSGYTKSGETCVLDKKTCEDYGYVSESPTELPIQKCKTIFVPELSDFCYTTDCKTCELGLKCTAGCSKYNMGENESDVYGCPRVCTSCNHVDPVKPSCGSQTLVVCGGINYCCEPRFASCYYTTPHDFANGTTTYLCSYHSMQEQIIDGVVDIGSGGSVNNGMTDKTEVTGGILDAGDMIDNLKPVLK